MTRRIWSIIICLMACQNLHGASNTIYNFLRNDVSSRAAAMAGSFVSITNDPNTIFYNPAALSTLEGPMGSVGFLKHLLDINAGYMSYAQSFEGLGNFGAGIVYTNYGTFDRIDELGNNLGTFSATDLALTVGYSNLLDENLHYGLNLKFIHSSIAEYSSEGVAGDLGILFEIPDSRISLGASVRNIGTQLTKYGSVEEDLPLDVMVGGSVVPKGLPLLLNLNFHKLNEDVEAFGDRFKAFTVGGEFVLGPSFQLRFGYDNEKRTDLKVGSSAGLAGFSGGLGIIIDQYRLDYSLSSLGKVGDLHRVSIGANL
jgi:hypothetical protein